MHSARMLLDRPRWNVSALLPASIARMLLQRFKTQRQEIDKLERQSEWLQRHQSPLHILSLPENVTDAGEIKRKYHELTLKHHPDHSGDRVELEKIQTAYKMLMDPKSLWYQDGNSSELAVHIGKMFHRKRQVQLFGIFLWMTAFSLLCYASVRFLIPLMEGLLQWADPEFFQFMVYRESVDEQDRLEGKVVEHDPIKLAPKSIKKLKYPGKYLDEL
mmetsp:Transcript_32351/g.50592  ORF Transcript_32351/g.50592 Transcript_32351/m.50592 type:complete len:217 (-) Transcript_32351:157-807(-)|eukprot:CAMPEP_0201529198 /NCGR_PEP_ID=MMETSP0161_2-20130828/40910_1 /ASSEMBLY_ACC=CAM_ASM_000251 /TAXON_ID=180227 /ORGANISM="Neoparamoeba aestuarina, Strain SoJaBio B1-5/56/2" /LENGTH=216 /DNA_ID=CAMNT_0047930885 /DNA_START=30 /DNA_END=680 /DNA_ORIENTATION=+